MIRQSHTAFSRCDSCQKFSLHNAIRTYQAMSRCDECQIRVGPQRIVANLIPEYQALLTLTQRRESISERYMTYGCLNGTGNRI